MTRCASLSDTFVDIATLNLMSISGSIVCGSASPKVTFCHSHARGQSSLLSCSFVQTTPLASLLQLAELNCTTITVANTPCGIIQRARWLDPQSSPYAVPIGIERDDALLFLKSYFRPKGDELKSVAHCCGRAVPLAPTELHKVANFSPPIHCPCEPLVKIFMCVPRSKFFGSAILPRVNCFAVIHSGRRIRIWKCPLA
jgi:hypothetical protein